MEILFYIFAIPAIIWELQVLFHTKKFIAFRKSITGKKSEEMTTNQKAFSILMFLYIFWNVVGFFTSQYLIFIAFFFFSFLPKPHLILKKLDALISIAVLIFIILNKYHLHINIINYLPWNQ